MDTKKHDKNIKKAFKTLELDDLRAGWFSAAFVALNESSPDQAKTYAEIAIQLTDLFNSQMSNPQFKIGPEHTNGGPTWWSKLLQKLN